MRWSIKFVLVYLGDVPDYVEKNAVNLSSLFKDIETVIITDSESSYQRLKGRGVSTWLCSDQFETNSKIIALSQHNARFRENFWLKTVLRFFALEEFLKQTETKEILHIEADVWISKDFPVDKIREVSTALAYPLKSKDQGIASTVFIPNLSILQRLNSFIIESFQSNAFSTDVSILGDFHRAFPQYFYNLPTSLPRDDFYLGHSSTQERSILSKNYETFEGLFDASSLGIYYTGIDPRNNWGWRDLFVSLDHKIDFKNSKLFIKDSVPYLQYKEIEVQIYSLHVHSKDKRFFDYGQSIRRLEFISSLNQTKRYREFSARDTPRILFKSAVVKLLLSLRDRKK